MSNKDDLKGLAAREAASSKNETRTINARARKVENPKFIDMLERLRDGQSIRGACGCSRFPRQTLYDWMDSDPEIKELVDQAIDEGFGQIEIKLMQGASQADDTDWRAVSWMLARRFPGEYGEKKELEIKSQKSDGIPEVLAMIEQTNKLMEQKDDDD